MKPQEITGLWLGLLGVVIFALTLVGFAVAVIATVFVGKKMPVRAANAQPQSTVDTGAGRARREGLTI